MPGPPCLNKSLCFDPATPINNYSAEAPDLNEFLGMDFGWDWNFPNLDGIWTEPNDPGVCTHPLTQEQANICAHRKEIERTVGGDPSGGGQPPWTDPGGNPIPLFGNEIKACQVFCPDGTLFAWTIAANEVKSTSQTMADRIAASLACQLARTNRMCISTVQTQSCLNEAFSNTVTVSTRFAQATMSVTGGALPPGLTLSQIGPKRFLIAGTPTATGNYSFTLTAQDPNGNVIQKSTTLAVVGITNLDTVPAGSVTQAYSFQLTADGGTAPYIFTLSGGSLPDGLTLAEDGTISGTPTTATTDPFTVQLQDASGNSCLFQVTVKVTAAGFVICNWPAVRASLDVASWPVSANPAWDGIFGLKTADSFGDTIWYFIDQSILGKKCAASDTVDYPNGPWQDQVNPGDCFALLSYNPGTGTWNMTLSQPDCTDGNYYSYSQLFSSNDPNDASGTYGKVVGGGTSPDTIIIEALSQTGCCPPASESMIAVPGVVGAGQPARMRIKNYDQSIFMPGAACVAFPVPPGTPVWDGTLPDKFTDNVTTLVYNDQNLGPPFARDRTIKGCLAVTMQLDYANSGPPYVYWELQIACGDGSVIWFGHKFHGTSPEGTYTLANGVNAPPGSPACLTLESY